MKDRVLADKCDSWSAQHAEADERLVFGRREADEERPHFRDRRRRGGEAS